MVTRVVVAEDNYLVREGVVRLLAAQPEIEVVGAFEDYDSLLAGVDAQIPDVVVTDIRMPPTGTDEGVRAANVLRERLSRDRCASCSASTWSPRTRSRCSRPVRIGRAYLLKERVSDVDVLVRAIEAVADGGSVIDPRVVEVLVSARARHQSPLDFLTPRESEVLAEMALGRNNAGIAAALGLSERAVEKHINSLFAKLGVSEEPDVHRRVKAVLLQLSERP